ncbi:MAG: hypothetical protein NXI04_18930 [Planctomycetaceae bacterium]|nr:hypothetical protein [Planctomycetaceae bacterium]
MTEPTHSPEKKNGAWFTRATDAVRSLVLLQPQALAPFVTYVIVFTGFAALFVDQLNTRNERLFRETSAAISADLEDRIRDAFNDLKLDEDLEPAEFAALKTSLLSASFEMETGLRTKILRDYASPQMLNLGWVFPTSVVALFLSIFVAQFVKNVESPVSDELDDDSEDESKDDPSNATHVVIPDNQEFRDQAVAAIRSMLTDESISKIRQHYGISEVEKTITESIKRLGDAITTLGKRANKNLGFGVCVAATGILVLGMMLLNGPPVTRTESTNSQLMVFFGTRVSLLFFTQVLAYFFLRLYSAGLADLKYYQNELTNISAYKAAIHTAIAKGNEEQLQTVVNSLMNVDRNTAMAANIPSKGKQSADLDKVVELVKQLKATP